MYKILIVRTDRIGDVVLSTPTIAATRAAFPEAYIAVMVSPQARDIVTGNPDLDEVILYDRRGKCRGIFTTLCLSGYLRIKKFNLALILHTTRSVNIMCFLAGIPRRVGYARGKLDFLLTDRLEYKKRLGEKHESEYSLDILRFLGLDVENYPLFMPVSEANKKKIDFLLRNEGLGQKDRLVVIHAGASSVSKMWPQENFAKVADLLIDRCNVKIIMVSGPEHVELSDRVRRMMKYKPVFLCGKTSLGELAALFKKARLFISNDSGPVHVACAVGTPVISIFGRNEKGLSHTRWGPIGKKVWVFHKEVGCAECLPDDCQKDFLCLKSITVEEVVEKAIQFLAL